MCSKDGHDEMMMWGMILLLCVAWQILAVWCVFKYLLKIKINFLEVIGLSFILIIIFPRFASLPLYLTVSRPVIYPRATPREQR